MIKNNQKKLTTKFFNEVSSEWSERTYDPSGQYLKFAGNKARMETVLNEIKILGLRGKILDIGCGSGQLVIELLKLGNKAYGIDIAEMMISNSKNNLKNAKLDADPNNIFKTSDLDDLRGSKETYDAVTGLGLLEYLDTDDELFKVLKKIIPSKSFAFVECRNKFFNIFSANSYTEQLTKNNKYSSLIKSFSESSKYSPIQEKDIPKIQTAVSIETGKFLEEVVQKDEWYETAVKKFTNYPKGMVRRQHTPQELEKSAKKYGFELKYVVYWHAHPYPPAFEKSFPKIYNKLSFLMAPLGRTPLGAWMCSSFVAVLQKK